MSLFQKSVINRHLRELDNDKVNEAFKSFRKFYGNKLRLVNIMQLKEENYQEGFLREIFVQSLGYTINPDTDYNLTTEYKNQKDSRKADGAIIRNGEAIGVIELKSTKTKNLENIKEQAFGYKNNQINCRYVITSNFQYLRFYINNAVEYEEFNLFNLSEKDFKLMYLLLSKYSIFNDIPLRIKKETKLHEEDISDKLYTDYKNFKDKIFKNLVENNPKYDKLTLFKKSRKLLDRFLFIFFAEDCALIPPNMISRIIERWKIFIENDLYISLYSQFQKLFTYIDKGYEFKNWGTIPAYNGGLFQKDEILDNIDIVIEDHILEKDSLKISAYNFKSEVDVNILGHIFEHSLNEVEEMEKHLSNFGNRNVLKTSKRKKDGIFYTPRYITKYIIENTVGLLCKEKKQELNLLAETIEDFNIINYQTKAKRTSAKAKKLLNILNDYKKWLLSLKILDPACGSGAFLNATLDFLISEHLHIDNIISELIKDPLRILDTDKVILENNIYGVDINEESVEITKLSLWLRTAKSGRILSDLSNNIKCGNSLIDDPKIAGNKAFDWNTEFKEIMEKGGFDAVIGNPPWGSKIHVKNVKFIADKYNITSKNFNLFLPFIYLSYDVVKQTGISHLLIPKVFIKNTSYTNTRKILLENSFILQLSDYGKFPGVASETVSLAYSKQKLNNKINITKYCQDSNNYKTHQIIQDIFLRNSIYAFSFQINNEKSILLEKIKEKGINLSEIVKINRGIEIGQNSNIIKCDNCGAYNIMSSKYYSKKTGLCKLCKQIINNKNIISISKRKIDEFYKIKCFSGREIKRYSVNNLYYIPEQLKSINYKNNINEEKIFIKRISTNIQAVYFPENNKTLSFNTLYNLYNFKVNPLFILGILNSKLLNFYYEFNFNLGMNLTTQITIEYLKTIPILTTSTGNKQITKQVYKILSLNEKLQKKSKKFIKRIISNFDIGKLTNKLKKFYDSDFKTFVNELKNKKIKLSLRQQDEWEDYFDDYKYEINNLQNRIKKTDNEIDKMVYKLYELTEEEIEIIEKSVK